MGVKRIARKNLYNAEKLGIDKASDVDVSPAMRKALISATQHRVGYKVITDMVFDFGASAAALLTKALAAADPVGPSGTAVSYLCNLGESTFGIVSSVETICLEAITDGTLTDYDLQLAGDGTLDGDPSSGNDGYFGSDATGDSALLEGIGAVVGVHKIASMEGTDFSARALQNRYLYLTSGAATGQKASAIIDCTSATPGNIADGVDTIRLINSDGSTGVLFVAESDTAYNAGSPQANKFNIGSMTTTAHLATSLAEGINNNGAFDAVVTDSTKVTVTHAASTATSNHQAGYLLNDDPQASNGISIGEFTGGIDDGVAISSGKLLIRVTGFMVPDDH